MPEIIEFAHREERRKGKENQQEIDEGGNEENDVEIRFKLTKISFQNEENLNGEKKKENESFVNFNDLKGCNIFLHFLLIFFIDFFLDFF